ncbi:MAG: hypothetical protein LBQ12_04045 [Deltaproteobacteria bacterium]|jgi:hypothetical protein|nr:hypothetical protein [Deltaproteobacteria bacterium]
MCAEEKKPFLSPFDFIRIARSASLSVLRTARGAAPPLPRALELEDRTLGEAGLTGYIPAIHAALAELLDLGGGELAPPDPSSTFAAWSESLAKAFNAKKPPALAFSDRDALGAPRRTVHTAAMLAEEADSASFLFSGRRRVLSTVPLIHSFGFVFGLLIPRRLRIPSADVPPSPTLSGRPLQKGDLAVLFPQLLKLLSVAPPPDAALLCSSSPPLEGRYFRTARTAGYLSLAEIYGTSLTGALGWRKSGEPYELFGHFQRQGEKSILRPSTGAILASNRLLWRRERHFSRFGSEDEDKQP